MKKEMVAGLNGQVNMELSAAYSYFAMATYFLERNFAGFAAWMQAQAKEELTHAMKIHHYLVDRCAQVAFEGIKAPTKLNADEPMEIFALALKQEMRVSESIHALMDSAIDCKDFASQELLQWFVKEQIEEENTLKSIIEQFKLVGKQAAALMMLNDKLGQRQ
jgi:ferritin